MLCAGAGVASALLAGARLLLRNGQGWGGAELAPALLVEGLLCASLLAIPIWGALRGGRGAGVAAAVALVVVLQGAGWWSLPVEERAPPGSPLGGGGRTVVLITADTLRRDFVSAYPDARVPGLTPHLEALASSGALFSDAVTAAPLTLPSHVTLLTGEDAPRHGVVRNGSAVPRDLPAVPAELGARGWHTGAFTSSLVLHGAHGLGSWFQTYRDDHARLPGLGHLLLGRAVGWASRELLARPRDVLGKEPGDRTVDRALAWLAGRPEDADVFLWVHLYDAHTPYLDHGAPPAGDPFARLPHPCDYADHPAGLHRSGAAAFGFTRAPLPAAARCRARGWETVRADVAGYAAEVAFLDQQVGRLVEGLGSVGRADAAVVFVADHGESLTEHQQLSAHQYDVYDPVMRVPLMVRAPATCRGCVLEPQVSTRRVAATLRFLAGQSADREATVFGAGDPAAVALGPAGWSGSPLDAPVGFQAGARSASAKVLVTDRGHVERYHLDVDPGERFPLVLGSERARLEQVLASILEPGRASSGGEEVAGPRRALPPLFRPRRPTPAVVEALEQPGYRGASLDQVDPHLAQLEELARAALGQMAREGPRPRLPEEVRESLEALGYLR